VKVILLFPTSFPLFLSIFQEVATTTARSQQYHTPSPLTQVQEYSFDKIDSNNISQTKLRKKKKKEIWFSKSSSILLSLTNQIRTFCNTLIKIHIFSSKKGQQKSDVLQS
jgi:hypothetical protein